MGFKVGCLPALLLNVLLCSGLASAQVDAPLHITVVAYDSVGVGPTILRLAEKEASRLFEGAGVEIEWANCPPRKKCLHVLRSNDFMLRIVSGGRKLSDLVFGEAFLGEDGRGQDCDVFFDRIPPTQLEANVARMLGALSAHELGHLLLGSHSHSRTGIMTAVWDKGTVRKIETELLEGFTREQGEKMRRRIEQQDATVHVNSINTRSRVDY